jgi:threonine dehydrogenase-like Zn-dependent dehydrogenase
MCLRVPPACSDEAAALAQPLAVALHALARSQIQPGMRVALFGLGGIGSLLLAALAVQPSRQPTRLFCLDIDPARLRKACQMARVDLALNVQVDDALSMLSRATTGEGVDLAIEATGQPETLLLALASLRRGGRLLQVGLPREPVAVPMADLVLREQEVITTNGQICQVDLPAALDLLATTDLASRIDITCISLDELVARGLLPLAEHRAPGKIVVRIS